MSFTLRVLSDTTYRYSPDRARDLEEGWHQQYQGTTLEHFLQAMTWYESNYDPVKHYGRIVAIIQSSGSGKSRLVDELALKVCQADSFRSPVNPRSARSQYLLRSILSLMLFSAKRTISPLVGHPEIDWRSSFSKTIPNKGR